MKKLILTLAIPVALGTAVLTSCQEKTKTKEKPAAKTTEPVSEPKTEDTTTASLPATDTTAAQTETVAEKTTDSGQKFGHINSADLIKLMPETKKADASLAAYVKGLEKQLGSLQTDYQKKIAEYQSQERTMVDAIKQTKIQAIQQLEQQMQESQMDGQQKISAKREVLYKPILDKAEKAIKEVGKENGYDYVFDTNSGAFIYSKDSHDVMPLVKKKLGIK